MKLYEAINDEDNLIYAKSYVGYEFDFKEAVETGKDIVLTHVMSSNRLIQLNNPIITNLCNLDVIEDSVSVGLNPSAKPIARGNRGGVR